MAEDRKNRRQSSKDTEQTAPKRMAVSGDLSKTSKEHADNLSEIVKLEEKIAKIARMNFESAKGQALQIKKIAELAQMRNEFLEDTKRIEKNIEDILDEEEKSEKSIVQLTRQRRDNLKDTRNLSDEIAKSIRVANSETKDLSDIGKVVTQNMQATVNFSKEFGNVTERAGNLLQSGVNLSEEFMNKIEETKQVKKEYRDMEFEIATNAEKAAKGQYDAESVQQDLIKKRQKLRAEEEEFIDKTKEFLKNKNKMSKEDQTAKLVELQMEKQILRARNLQLGVFEEQNEALKEASKTAEKTLGVMEKITSGDFKGALLQKFGLDDINKQLKEKVGGALVNVVQAVKGGDLKGAFSAAGDGLGQMVKIAPMFMKALGIGALVGIVGFIVESFHKVDEEVSQLGKDMGISKHEAIELHHTATDLAGEMKLVGINSAEVAKGIKMTSEMMGGIDIASRLASGNEQAKQLVKDVTVLSEKFGLSADEIKSVQDLATMSGKSMGQLTAEASTLNKGLMTSKESMKLLASIPKGVAVAFKGGTQELIKAAAKAKLLGMELGTVQGIGMGMLEIETSLEKEMEARVLTGKNLNFDAARYYALQGDTASLQDELLKQAGSLKDFQKMGPIQQKAMADAMNMTVEQMTTMLTNAENLKNLGIDQNKMTDLQSMNAEELNKELAKGGSKQYQDYVRNLAKEKESEETKKKLADAVTKLQEKLAKMVTPLIEIADKFLGILDSVGGLDVLLQGVGVILAVIATVWVAKKLVDGFNMVKGSVRAMKDGISGFFDMIKGPGSKAMSTLSDGASKVTDKLSGAAGKLTEKASGVASKVTDKVSGAAGKLTEKASGVASKATASLAEDKASQLAGSDIGSKKKGGGVSGFFEKMDPKKMLAGAVALLIVAAALYVAAKAMQEFSTGVSWEGVLMGIVTLGALVLAVVVLGNLMLSGVGGAAILAGAAALLILSAALWIMGKAMQEFAKAAVIMIPFFQAMVELPMGQLAKLALVLGLLGLAFAGLAVLSIPIMIGAVALGAMAGSLMLFGVAAMIASKGIGGISDTMKQLTDLDPSRFEGVANGLDVIGGAMMRMGAGSLMGAVGEGINKLFGGESPLDKVVGITQKLNPEKLASTAIAIKALADSFKYFAEETGKLKEFDTDKLDSIIERMEKVRQAEGGGGLSTAVTGVANAVTGFIGNLFGSPEQQSAQPVASTAGGTISGGGGGGTISGGGGGGSMANVEKKLDVLISVISKAVTQPTVIKFGEKTVEEIQTQLNFKKSYDVKVDNTYGRT